MIVALVGWNCVEKNNNPCLSFFPFPFSLFGFPFFLFIFLIEPANEELRFQRKFLPGLNQRQLRWEAHQWSRKAAIYYFPTVEGGRRAVSTFRSRDRMG